MPTAKLLVEKQFAENVEAPIYVPYFHGGALKALAFEFDTEATDDRIFIDDYTNKDVKQLTATLPFSDLIKWNAKPWRIVETKNKIIMYAVGARSGTLEVMKVVFDKNDETISVSSVKSITADFMTGWAAIAKAVIVGDTLYTRDGDDVPYFHVVDLVTGTHVSVDLSAQFDYAVTPSLKISNIFRDTTHRQLMVIGHHLNGDSHYVMDINRFEVVATLESAGGGSSRPLACCPAVFTDEKIYPLPNGGVVGVDNDILFYDEHFNYLGTCDLAPITDYAQCTEGFAILARLTDGRYFAIGAITRNESTTLKIGHLCWIFLKSDFSYDSHYVIYQAPPDTNKIDIDNAMREFGNQTELPIIDVRNYKAYIRVSLPNNVVRLYEIDFSDLDVDEINSYAYLIE